MPKLDRDPRLQGSAEPVISWARKIINAVNQIIDWMGSGTTPSSGTNAWGNVLTVVAQPPTTGKGAAIVLASAPTDGAVVIAAERPANTRIWNINMISPDVAGNFTIDGFTDGGSYLGTAFQITRSTRLVTLQAALDVGTNALVRGTNVSIGTGTNSAYVAFNKAANFWNYLEGQQASKIRWRIYLGDNAAESGGNAGSNFGITAWDDAGTSVIFSPLSIDRATGVTTFVNGSVNGYVIQVQGTGGSGGGIRFASSGGAKTVRCVGTNLEIVNSAYNAVVASVTDTGSVSAQAYTASAFYGLTVNGTNGDGSTYIYQDLITGNPSWGTFYFRTWHQFSTWAGYLMSSAGNQIQFYLSNGGSWGSIYAASFNVSSDERAKKDVAKLDRKASAFMAIAPIKWKWPDVPAAKAGDSPIYADTREKWGFSAQNLSEAVPESVHGDVNAVDDKGEPVTAGVDPVPILAMTVIELQALIREVADLRAQVETLKGAKNG